MKKIAVIRCMSIIQHICHLISCSLIKHSIMKQQKKIPEKPVAEHGTPPKTLWRTGASLNGFIQYSADAYGCREAKNRANIINVWAPNWFNECVSSHANFTFAVATGASVTAILPKSISIKWWMTAMTDGFRFGFIRWLCMCGFTPSPSTGHISHRATPLAHGFLD